MFLQGLIPEALILGLENGSTAPRRSKVGQEMTREQRSRRYLISTATCWGDMLGALVSVVNCELVDVLDTITSQAPLPLRLRWEELWREHQQRRFQKRLINRYKRYKRLVHSAKRNPPPPQSTPRAHENKHDRTHPKRNKTDTTQYQMQHFLLHNILY